MTTRVKTIALMLMEKIGLSDNTLQFVQRVTPIECSDAIRKEISPRGDFKILSAPSQSLKSRSVQASAAFDVFTRCYVIRKMRRTGNHHADMVTYCVASQPQLNLLFFRVCHRD